jgi:hypothetical protein
VDRRTALTVLAGAAAATAGCGFVEPEPTGGGEETPPPPAEDPDRQVADSVPASRRFSPAATADSGLTLEALGWHGHDRVRYAPDDGDGFKFYEPPEGWVLAYDFALSNRGEEPLDAVTDYGFVLRVDGAEYDHRHALGDVSLSQVNQPDGEAEIRRLTWYSELDPGERKRLQLVFEASKAPDAAHYLVWYHGGQIEGADAPAYLLPEG